MMVLREILFDTETTGFDPLNGDRLVEIGCVEMLDKIIQKERKFHHYVNPERDVPEAAFKVHGLSTDFLADKPLFGHIVSDFLDFIGDAPLVAHNAEFDMKFINFELQNAGLPPLAATRFIDTLAIARRKFPGQANSLDALCRRFEIDNSHRTLHGALLDAEILADVYIELTVGRQAGLDFAREVGRQNQIAKKTRPKRDFPLSADILETHRLFIEKQVQNSLWLQKNTTQHKTDREPIEPNS